jgi:hypothetical protein
VVALWSDEHVPPRPRAGLACSQDFCGTRTPNADYHHESNHNVQLLKVWANDIEQHRTYRYYILTQQSTIGQTLLAPKQLFTIRISRSIERSTITILNPTTQLFPFDHLRKSSIPVNLTAFLQYSFVHVTWST